MKNYRFAITALLAAACLSVACEEDILRDVDECYITLDAENTYTVGKEVKFNIKGNPDYIYFFPGDTGHKYEYRDRTTIAMEDLETCKLIVRYNSRNGNYPGALDVYVAKTFEGLKGDDADADLATMRAIEASMDENKQIPGWDKLPYNEGGSQVWTTQEYDITEYADSFCLAFHWNTIGYDIVQRTYWIDYTVKTKFRGYDEVVTSGANRGLGLKTLNMNLEDPYAVGNNEGWMHLTGAYHIIMKGAAANSLTYAANAWAITTPQPLNKISPDEGFSVKAIADDIYQYGYVYEKPGTYEATFMITNGNYQGTERKLQKMTVNIIEPIGTGGEPEGTPAE